MKLLFLRTNVLYARNHHGNCTGGLCPHRQSRLLYVIDQAGATPRHLDDVDDVPDHILDCLAGYETGIPWAVVTDRAVDLGRDNWRLVLCDPAVGLTDSGADKLIGVLTEGEP